MPVHKMGSGYQWKDKQMSVEQVAFIAGIVDGEGHLGLHKRPRGDYVICLEVNMADHDTVRKIHFWSKCGKLYLYEHRGKEKAHNLPVLRWIVRRKDELMFLLPKIQPYLCIRKKTKIDEILNHLEKIKGRRLRINNKSKYAYK